MKNSDLLTLFKEQLVLLSDESAHFSIALSGGLDSVVLLHLFSRIENSIVTAHHIHHGLSENADSWARFCLQLCASLNLPYTVSQVFIDKKTRTSLEAESHEKNVMQH